MRMESLKDGRKRQNQCFHHDFHPESERSYILWKPLDPFKALSIMFEKYSVSPGSRS